MIDFEYFVNERAAIVMIAVCGAGIFGLTGLLLAGRWRESLAALSAIVIPAAVTYVVLAHASGFGDFPRRLSVQLVATIATYLFEATAVFCLLGATTRARRITRDGLLEPLRAGRLLRSYAGSDRTTARRRGAATAAVGLSIIVAAVAIGDALVGARMQLLEVAAYAAGYVLLTSGLYASVLVGYLAVDLIGDPSIL